MSVVGLDSVTYGVDDPVLCQQFFTDFGLEVLDRGTSGGDLAVVGEGARISVRHFADKGLPASVEGRPTIREVVWGLKDADAYERLAADLAVDHEVEESGGGFRLTDPMGISLAFQVTAVDRRVPDLSPRPPRVNRRVDYLDRAVPEHLGHVVYMTPDVERTAAFYTGRLGFTVSDLVRSDGLVTGMFLRAGGAHNHHNLFLLHHPRRTGLHHLSFRVTGGVDGVGVGKEQMESGGWRSVWGIGRHKIGSDQFVYLRNPGGGLVEYHADEDVIVDPAAWEAGEWDVHETIYWGGRPPAETRH